MALSSDQTAGGGGNADALDGISRATRGAALATSVVFTVTTLLSAFLLFLIQPMFAKMVLPVLGGSPSVWVVALLFFQTALLVGYAWAHALIRFAPLKWTGPIHFGLALFAAVLLPVALPDAWGAPPLGEPYFWQLQLFAVAVGLPFVAVAANAPLLQAWFSRAGQVAGRDPYFLYAASNLGSFVALLGYPFVFEPWIGLRQLSIVWASLYALLLAGLVACFALTVLNARAADATVPADGTEVARSPGWLDRLEWIGLALVPSALLAAFTTHIATDVASAPLIWVVPLAIYLLSFVVVFRERAWIALPLLRWVHLLTVLFALLQLAQTKHDKWLLTAGAGLAAFLTSCLVAHRTLYEGRPAPRYLTQFYLFMSLGGALGGVLAALIAPRVFSEVFEYPLLLALTVACRPHALNISRIGKSGMAILSAVIALGAIIIVYGPGWAAKADFDFGGWGTTAGIAAIFATAALALWRVPPAQLAAVLLVCEAVILLPSSVRRGDAQRSYFGVYRVSLSDEGDWNVLTHGTTLHGAQRVRDGAGKLIADITPGTYYFPGSPMAKSIDAVRGRLTLAGQKGTYGVIGLGSGSLACLSKPGETWRFFEIDKVVVDIATKSNNFTFMENCQPHAEIVMGDARLTLASQKSETFDLLIVDAFSSDAIPVHLMTAEALALYAEKLKPEGILVLHISNRYLSLEKVLASTIRLVPQLKGLIVSDNSTDGGYAQCASTIAVFSKDTLALDPFRALDIAQDFQDAGMKPWSDDSSDILAPLLSGLKD